MLFGPALKYYLFSRPHPCRENEDPFVRSLLEVMHDRTNHADYRTMAAARRQYLAGREKIHLHDLGAGHGGTKEAHPVHTLRHIARHSSGNPKYHRLLCRLARHFSPSVILETGTALGLGTLALTLGAPHARVCTIEGDPALSARARQLFEKYSLRNITLVEGSFEEKLPEVLARERRIDMAFLDGHHEEEATLRYFGMLLPRLHTGSLVVVDDIHWSKGMARAWNKIRRHGKVTLAIDIFRMGILFFDPSLPKRTLVVRY